MARTTGCIDRFVTIDAIDRKILAVLQSDGRITVTDLARQVNLSVSRCLRRLRELESAAVILGYRAEVDGDALDVGFEALLFVTLQDVSRLDEFDEQLAAIPNVVEAQRLFGEPDCLIRVVTKDLASYQQLYEQRLSRLPGVQRISSTIIIKDVVPRRPLPT